MQKNKTPPPICKSLKRPWPGASLTIVENETMELNHHDHPERRLSMDSPSPLPNWRRFPVSQELLQRCVPFLSEGFCKLIYGFRQRDSSSPHLRSGCLRSCIRRNHSIRVNLGEDQPTVIPGTIRMWILVNAVLGFFDTLGAAA